MILLLQMCVQWKKPEVSIMYLRGDISILVPAVFRTIVAIFTAPAVTVQKLSWPQIELVHVSVNTHIPLI